MRAVDHRGKFVAWALYSDASQIALRLLSRHDGPAPLWPSLISNRIADAVAYRKKVVRDSEAFRVVFSESDFLPGLIIDCYHDIVCFQALTQAMDLDSARAEIQSAILQQLAPQTIVERVDARIRQLENLSPRESAAVHGERSTTIFHCNGIAFHFDALGGQKTGAFLDQRENYAAAAAYAHGQALDCFCYHGGFALHLARVCEQVTGVDASRQALEAAEQNSLLNQAQQRAPEIEWLEGNVFDVLKDYATAHRQYDTIVLDPPPFARNKTALAKAMRGYKEINLRALKMLRPGGILVTCSCSQAVTDRDFEQMLISAASDAGRQVRLIEKRTQARDHPISLTIPESAYLKCFICSVS